MAINGSRVSSRFSKIWNRVRDEISRCFTAVLVRSDVPCNNCYYNSAEHSSSGEYKPGGPRPFKYGRCPICNGKGVIEVKIKKKIKGDIVWKGRASAMAKESLITFLPPGEEDMNIVRIKVSIKDKDVVNNADHFLVDGYKCYMLKPTAEAGIKHPSSLTFYVKTRDKLDVSS